MNKAEANIESLECARYGEDDDLRNLFVSEGADANFADESGTTAMHRAAANGEVGCMKILKEFGSGHTQNTQGNFPIHWAALNAQEAALKFLFENYDVDVLVKNAAGRSTLSEAFQTQKTEIIEICLSHSSASEENLLKTDADTRVTIDGDFAEKHAVVHEMDFSYSGDKKGKQNENNRRILKVRELPITRADSPFGSDTAPEDDTTGLGIWPAAVLLSRWVVQRQDLLRGKIVVELGAGCGLPSLAAAIYCGPKEVYLTDIHDPTLNNAAFNARLNAFKSPSEDGEGDVTVKMTSRADELFIEEVTIQSTDNAVLPMDIERMTISSNSELEGHTHAHTPHSEPSVMSTLRVSKVSWSDPATFPPQSDVLIGSDLVYDSKILGLLTQAVNGMLKPGGIFLYVAPDECRDGIDGLIDALKGVNVHCAVKEPCPEWMYENPFSGSDDEAEDSMDVDHAPEHETAAPHTAQHTASAAATVGGGGDNVAAKVPRVDRGDNYVLHFYDLAARKPHSLYQFVKA